MRDDRDCPSPDSTLENLLAPLAMSAPMGNHGCVLVVERTPQLAIPVDQPLLDFLCMLKQRRNSCNTPLCMSDLAAPSLKRCCPASIIASFAFN